MKKRSLVLLIAFGILIILHILSCVSYVNAGTVSISPGNNKFFFEPNLERTFDYSITSSDPNEVVSVYLSGDLAQYITLNQTFITGSGTIEATLKLPENIEVPGRHLILVGAIEGKQDSNTSGAVMSAVAAVQSSIEIFVPYPGKYVESSFSIGNINQGENAVYDLEVNNLGTEDITISPVIDIYGDNNIKLDSYNLENVDIRSKEKDSFTGIINSSGYKPGEYYAIANFDYGKPVSLNNSFRVGFLYLNITDYSYMFEEGKIGKFNIEADSLWNLKIDNVYAQVTITDNGKVLDTFNTASVDFQPWDKKNLTGFFDATKVKEGKYTANMVVYFENASNTKLVYIHVFKVPLNAFWIIIPLVVGAFILILIGVIIYLIVKLRRAKGKNETEKSEEKSGKKTKKQ